MADRDTIVTTRLRMRPPQADDFLAFFDMHNAPDVLALLGLSQTDRAAAWRTFAQLLGHWQLRGWGQWAVCDRETGRVIGRVGFWFPEGAPEIELGWLIERARWGQGLATEAACAAMVHGFEVCGFKRFVSTVRADNFRSVRIASKLGGRLERCENQGGSEQRIYAFS
jgi:RimJ/RimL family protein N-acetyltransferase